MSVQAVSPPRAAVAPVTTERLDSAQVLRGLAAFVVCLAHVAGAPQSDRFSPFLDWLRFQGDLGVQVFFLISGFVIPWSLVGRSYSWARFPRYMARRLLRLEPPYLVVLVLALAVAGYRAAQNSVPFPYDATTIALHAGYLVDLFSDRWIVAVFWTLGVEFQFYLVMGLVFPWLESAARSSRETDWRSSREWLYGFIVLLIVRGMLPLFGYLQYFGLGVLVFAARLGRVKRAVPLLACGLLLLHDWLRVAGGLEAALVLAAVSAVILVAPARLPFLRSSIGGRVLAQLGRISYSLYLIHLVILGRFIALADRRGIALTGLSGVLVFVTEVAVCLAAAWILYEAVEQPAMRISRRIGMEPLTTRPAGAVL